MTRAPRAAVAGQVAVFAMSAGRGLGEAAALLGADSHGVLHHDGWRPYYTFWDAVHQNCVGHEKGVEIETRRRTGSRREN